MGLSIKDVFGNFGDKATSAGSSNRNLQTSKQVKKQVDTGKAKFQTQSGGAKKVVGK